MELRRAKSILLRNNRVKKAFESKDLEDLKVNIGLQILELRLIRNLTQQQLAKKIGTQQPSIARVERGAVLPSLSFLHKIAKAAKTDLIYPKFALVEQNELASQIRSHLTINKFETESNPFLVMETRPLPRRSALTSVEVPT